MQNEQQANNQIETDIDISIGTHIRTQIKMQNQMNFCIIHFTRTMWQNSAFRDRGSIFDISVRAMGAI